MRHHPAADMGAQVAASQYTVYVVLEVLHPETYVNLKTMTGEGLASKHSGGPARHKSITTLSLAIIINLRTAHWQASLPKFNELHAEIRLNSIRTT